MRTRTGNPRSKDSSRYVSPLMFIQRKCRNDLAQQCIERPTRWAIHHLDPLPFYVSGRVALLGDAVSKARLNFEEI